MVKIEKMQPEHIDGVHEIELDSFSIPWSKHEFRSELEKEKLAIYYVAIVDGKPVGYAGMWHVVTEGHITNIAVSPGFRRKGVGAALLERLIETAKEKEMLGITLEVRMNNEAAQKLYTKYGFKHEGIRKGYYSDTGEDALIMWKYF